MSVASIALALRESFFARLAVLPALAMFAYACVNEAPVPVPRDDSNAIAAEATDVAVTPAPRNDNNVIATEATAPPITPAPRNDANAAVSPTPQVAAESQEPMTATPTSSEENSSNANEKPEWALSSVSYMPDQGFVSLNERILRSTVIARATMRSASAYAHDGTTTPKTYSPRIKFTFDVHEYLKGNGANVIAVNISIKCTEWDWEKCNSPEEQDVIDHANAWLSEETNRWWETRESIIFLQEDNNRDSKATGESSLPSYKFVPWLGEYATTRQYPYSDNDGFSVLSDRNRVWLPTTSATKDASGTSEPRFMLGDKPANPHPQQSATGSSTFKADISLSDLKIQINAIINLISQNADTEEYEECLRAKAWRERIPWTPYSLDFSIQSGLGAGAIIDSIVTGGRQHYRIYFFSGANKSFFEIALIDDDSNPYNNYYRTVRTTRPLAAGDYAIVYHQMLGILRLCIGSPVEAYTDTPTANWTIRATAPSGTLHEAFFDPVAIGAAVGADGDNGALTPVAFPVAGGADVEIRRIDWDADVVKIEIANPPASLADHYIDFIALDGSIALRLAFGDAAVADAGVVRTFSWGVCGQPWSAGDKLMLRISESAVDVAGAANDASCLGEIEPTPAATPAAGG